MLNSKYIEFCLFKHIFTFTIGRCNSYKTRTVKYIQNSSIRLQKYRITYDTLPLVSDFAKNTSKINILKAFLILIIYTSNKLIRLIVKYFINFLYITGYLCIILV